MKLIYWNVKKQPNLEVIDEILRQELPEVMFLAEAGKTLSNELIEKLAKFDYMHFENPGCERIKIIKQKDANLSLSCQSTYYSSVKEINTKVQIISVHLPSQMFQSIDGLKSFFRELRSEIDVEFGNSLDRDIVIIGDFNINPFEKPMIDFDGFSASNSIRLNREAVHLSKKKALYYNPTWTLYTRNHFPGSNYYKRPSNFSFDILEHHFLDQVLLSYSLSQKISFERIDMLYSTPKFEIFDQKRNIINYSDHLPLIYEFKL